jgi:DNA-binding transcriptional LysR family regulator
MNLRFVEAFYWVATFKSVTRAAEKLFLTQSAMSSRIAALEEELGVLLLDRRDKQFRLTPAGARFVVYAEHMLETLRNIKSELTSDRQLTVSVRIGAIESVLHSWLIPLVEMLRERNPALEFELTVETTPVLTEQIRRGSLDLIFAALPSDADGIRSRVLPPLEMVFVGAKGIHKKRAYTLAALSEFDWLTFQRGSVPQLALVDLCKRNHVRSGRQHAVSSISAMAQLVQAGFGVATLPRSALKRAGGLANSLGLVELKCDVPLPPLPIYASYRFDPTSKAVEHVIDAAITFVEQQLPINLSAPAVKRAKKTPILTKAASKKSMT